MNGMIASGKIVAMVVLFVTMVIASVLCDALSWAFISIQ